MAFTLTIDGYDLSPYLRVHPEDGFDPQDADLLEPGFGEQSGDNGSPLLSVQAGNREMVFPVHLTPKVTANYPDTKQGLHDLLRDINGLLTNANGKQLVWQDEGATNPTTFDVVYARFESEYNFRRAQVLYATGIIRVWAKPYGHTGTYRILGTAVATGVSAAIAVPAGSVGGDVPANINITIGMPSYRPEDTRAVGVAVVPSGYVYDIPVASMIRINAANVPSSQDPFGVGSHSIGPLAIGPQPRDFGILALSPATMYAGRNRLLAVGRGLGKLLAYSDRQLIGEAQGSVISRTGHQTFDLGVLDVNPAPGQATVTVGLKYEFPIVVGQENAIETESFERWDSDSLVGLTGTHPRLTINRFIIVPNDDLALSYDNSRKLLAYEFFDYYAQSYAGVATIALPTIDRLGNTLTTASMFFSFSLSQNAGIAGIAYNPLTSMQVNHPEAADLDIQVAFVQGFAAGEAVGSTAIIVGKQVASVAFGGATSTRLHAAKMMNNTATTFSFSLFTGSTLIASVGGNISVGMPSSPWPGGVLQLRFVGSQASAEVRTRLGGIVATVAGGNTAFMMPGITNISLCGTGVSNQTPFVDPYTIDGFLVSETPSMARAPRDNITFSSASQSAWMSTVASVFVRPMTDTIRGAIPQSMPTVPHSIVALNLPMNGWQRASDYLSIDVRVQERFRYVR